MLLKKEAIHIINFYIKNNDEEINRNNINYKKRKNTIIFNVDSDEYKFDTEKLVLEKENSESLLKFIFDNKEETNGTYYIKELDFYMDAKIKTNNLIKEKNNIEIEYELYLQDEYIGNFIFRITVKE